MRVSYKKIKANEDIVLYLDYLSDVDRLAVLSKADLLALPSFYEGFGMQLLEAFEAGVPVAASNISSLPEVAGQAAVYFDPHDIRDIKTAMKNILFDASLSQNLITKGKGRLKDFSWEKCARETLNVILHS
jgi:glycosyltransferase involved in cell wall biosynthesis